MILDTIANADRYLSVHPGFKKAFEAIKKADTAFLKEGKTEIEGKQVYASVAFPEGMGRGKAKLEAHRKYIDIQVSLKGEDVIGWRNTGTCRKVDIKYDPDKDCEFFSDVPVSWFKLVPGHFAVFFPDDAHAPLAGEGKIHKLVVKVAV
jgi:biofilm protein TabA